MPALSFRFRAGALALLGALAAAPAPAAPPAEVHLLGTVHSRHERLDAYGFEDLRSIVEDIAPDVLLLELTPEELATRTPSVGKQEYPRVLFPLMDAGDYVVEVWEPGGALFEDITGAAARGRERLARERPDAAAALDAYDRALRTLMETAVWAGPADLHAGISDALHAAHARVRGALAPEERAAQARWNAYMLERIAETARAHPGARILVMVGATHHHAIAPAVRALDGVEAIDMVARLCDWARRRGRPGGSACSAPEPAAPPPARAHQSARLAPTRNRNPANTRFSAAPLIAWARRVPNGAASTDAIATPIAAGR